MKHGRGVLDPCVGGRGTWRGENRTICKHKEGGSHEKLLKVFKNAVPGLRNSAEQKLSNLVKKLLLQRCAYYFTCIQIIMLGQSGKPPLQSYAYFYKATGFGDSVQ